MERDYTKFLATEFVTNPERAYPKLNKCVIFQENWISQENWNNESHNFTLFFRKIYGLVTST